LIHLQGLKIISKKPSLKDKKQQAEALLATSFLLVACLS
jgi:hypothetical protein